MIDAKMVKDLLQAMGEGQYVGTPNTKLMDVFVGDFDEADENAREKFIYHMDELFTAGLYRSKDLTDEYGWGGNIRH